jgi:hypothetical protein
MVNVIWQNLRKIVNAVINCLPCFQTITTFINTHVIVYSGMKLFLFTIYWNDLRTFEFLGLATCLMLGDPICM